MEIRKIRPEEYLETRKIFAMSFEFATTLPTTNSELIERLKTAPTSNTEQHYMERWAAFADDGKMFASIATIPFTVRFDGQEVGMCGIGDVCTLPAYRRGGAIRKIFDQALPEMFEKGQLFSYLFPFSTAFYRKFGYELSCDTVTYTVALDAIKKRSTNGYVKLYEQPEDLPDFQAVYAQFAAALNLSVVRDDTLWRYRLGNSDPVKDAQYSYLWYNDAGEPKAYMTYHGVWDGPRHIMDVGDIAFLDMEGFYGLCDFAASFTSHYSHLRFTLPSSMPILHAFPELSQGKLERTLGARGMCRVVNAQEVLKRARYRGCGAFTVQVVDDQIAQNNAVFAVQFSDGETQVTITDVPADIVLPIQEFSRMITGVYDLADAQLLPGVKIRDNRENLKKAFYHKPTFIAEFF